MQGVTHVASSGSNQPIVDIRVTKRRAGQSVAPRDVLIDGEHRATFTPMLGSRRLKLHLLDGRAASAVKDGSSWPVYYATASLEASDLAEIATAALSDGALPSVEQQKAIEAHREAEEAEQRFEAKCRGAGPRLYKALKKLVPEDFDEHPQDFAEDWLEARAAIREVEES